MRNSIRTSFAIIAALSTVLLLSACPKKVETAKGTATVKEEKMAPPAEEMAPEAAPAPPMEETPVTREAEMPSGGMGLTDAYFDYDKYNIRDDARAALENDARWLKDNPAVRVKIEGHCDERGTNEYNLALGERRAQSTKRFLTALGVDAGRLSTISYGEERPVCMDHSEGCYAKNRRAHILAQ